MPRRSSRSIRRPGRLRRIAFRASAAGLAVAATYLVAELLLAPILHARFGAFAAAFFVADIDHRMLPNDPRFPTNGDGIRSLRESGEFGERGYNVILLGDSFVFGRGLTIEQSIPVKVERFLRDRFPASDVKVANFGWLTSSPILDLRLLRDIGHKYRPDLIALCIDMGDFHDELVYERMFEENDVHRRLGRMPIFVTAMRSLAPETYKALLDRLTSIEVPRRPFFMSHAPLEMTRPFADTLMRNVERIGDYARAYEARFAVFVFPRHYQYNSREVPRNWERHEYDLDGDYNLEPFRFFEEQRERADYPIHSLLEAFRTTTVFPTCFDDDPHWNDAGATVAAEAIAVLLADAISADTGAAAGDPPAN